MRPRIVRRDLSSALQSLNSQETNPHGRWQTDNREMTSAVKFLDTAGTLAASRLQPDEVADVLQQSSSLAAVS
ncbi:MAG TPA: hypothetical protein VE931_04135 [Pyrinomonadaceae bacterium]|nr:hypothetical protein [Pyrinomonadaceae bacterium]